MNNVTKFGVQELNAKEMVEVEGGRVHWLLYVVSPFPAYVADKFFDGVNSTL